MQPSTVADLFALAIVGGVVIVAAAVVVPAARERLLVHALPLAAVIATGATLGSLYFSEIADFVPCRLCWFQRIAMYPLAVLLVLATVWRDRTIFRYVVALAAAGAATSAYHVWIQWFPERSNFCEFDNPCSAVWVEGFGVFTIPQMAGLCFVLLATIATVVLVSARGAARDV